MLVEKSEAVLIRSSDDVAMARHVVRQHALALGFSLVDQTKVVTAASELARNIIVHGGGDGRAVVEQVHDGLRRGLRIVFEDSGPGIPDISLALRDGYTTGGGLGMGLSGSRRLMHEFAIDSEVGRGTRITVVRWK